MKYSKLLFWIVTVFLLVLTLKSASAVLNDTAFAYRMDNATTVGVTVVDSSGQRNATNNNINISGYNGKINESYGYWNGRITTLANNLDSNWNDGFTTSFWFNAKNQTGWGGVGLYRYRKNGEKIQGQLGYGGNANIICFAIEGNVGGWKFVCDANMPSNSWVHYIHQYNGSHLNMYSNGTLINSTLLGVAIKIQALQVNDIRNLVNGGVFLDEYYFWNRTLTTSEIGSLWSNMSNGIQYPFTASPAPVVDDLNLSANPYPTLAQYNSNPSGPLWATANASNPWTCRLYLNGTVNQSKVMLNGTNVNCSFTINLSNGGWTYFIRGNTSTNSENTSNGKLYYDDVSPIITVINWTNQTIRYTQNITGQWNITDNFYLHRLNVSIDGSQIFGVVDINATSYLYNLSYNVTSLSPGSHIINITVADGHTAKSIPDYNWYNGLFNDYLQYETGKAIIRIDAVDGSIWDSFTSKKEKDRYTFDYEPYDTKKTTYSFEVNSNKQLRIAKKPTSEISQWLIIDDHWLDFYIPGTTVNIKKINEYTARIDVTGITDKSKLSFSSIGDLNIVSRLFNFTTTNLTATYSKFINELSPQTILLRINNTGSITGTNAVLIWNGTVMNVTKTITASHDLYNSTFNIPAIGSATQLINFNWLYNITGTVNNLTGNLSLNQTIIQIGIDNCSTFTTRAINISLRDESNNSLVIGDIRGYFSVWVSSISQFRAFNLSWTGNSTYGLCINNASANYTTDAQLEYWATGYENKNYYFDDIILDNVTDTLNLFLTKNTTQVTLKVTDYDDDAIKDVLIHIQSYDLGTNSYKTTEIVKTDFQGKAFAEMILYTQWYQFMLIYKGQTVLQTDATKLTSNTLNFQIDLGSNPLSDYNVVEKMVCAVSFNNATNNFRFDFNNPSGNPILATLDVYNSTTYITNLLNTSSLTSASGTILINIGTPKNETYTGKGYVTINNQKYICGVPSSVSYGKDYITWGLQGIFFTMLVCIFLVCVGIWSPAIAVLLLIIAIIITNLFGMFHLNTPYLITLIILGGITLYRLARNRV